LSQNVHDRIFPGTTMDQSRNCSVAERDVRTLNLDEVTAIGKGRIHGLIIVIHSFRELE
jgi:hypothetical protein